ncbi:hypothetical protein M413DRAFT_204872 [Hebeloma cylindrosporum]|uniref:Lysine-specific metallo-endopeptidase domain-containing protein n=1 Tax=Hebeloma cylindrosporum TaxID=76867 RepID=A0A0C2YCV7_HEBCY|nr:hypothetical protein M413DRAFT_204872 [Hebeloma cylindrosporum h7]
MFSSSVRSILIAFVLATVAAAATPALSVNLAGPRSVTGVENLKVVATITNTGDETLKILNDPRSLLSKRPVNKFSITDGRGARPAFTGVKVKYSPESAAKMGAFTVLEPGAFIDVTHDLSEGYNFTSPGAGTYDFEADRTFYIVKDNNEIGVVHADAAEAAYTAEVVGNLAVARRDESSSGLSKRATFVSCTAARQTLINAAAASAETYAANAYAYINSHTTGTTRFNTWFGTLTSARRATVLSHFKAIDGNTFSSFTYDCSCTDSSYAYVYPSQFGKVYFCGAYWNAPNTGTDSKAGTIIHEASHFTANGGTNDYAYGHSAAKSLAINNPANAVMNADSHEYFAEINPALA